MIPESGQTTEGFKSVPIPVRPPGSKPPRHPQNPARPQKRQRWQVRTRNVTAYHASRRNWESCAVPSHGSFSTALAYMLSVATEYAERLHDQFGFVNLAYPERDEKIFPEVTVMQYGQRAQVSIWHKDKSTDSSRLVIYEVIPISTSEEENKS